MVEEGIKEDIEIFYKSKPVKQVQLLILRILCSGTIPIMPKDYVSPITINMGKATRILSAQIINKNPEDLEIELTIKENAVVLERVLLNPKESITLRIFADKINPDIQIRGRWAGVKIVNQLSEESKLANAFYWGALVSLALGMGLGPIGQWFGIISRSDVTPFIFIVIGFSLLLVYIVWMRRKDVRSRKELEILAAKTNVDSS